LLVIERTIDISTPDGTMPTFVVHADREEPAPIVLVLMDGLGFREALRDVARRLASSGYYVMLPDLYYRSGRDQRIERGQPRAWDRLTLLVLSLTNERMVRDAEALLAFAQSEAAAKSSAAAGVMGFCIGGRIAAVLAQALGDRLGAAASVHPGNLATDEEGSPHRNVDRVRAELYFAIADRDQWCPPEQVSQIERALADHAVRHEIEWHHGSLHGFSLPDGDSYDETAAERVWERTLALFHRTLR